jgi:hypothetical protein
MKQKTAEAMRPIVEAYARYKGSKKVFCEEQNIAAHTLDYWRSKFNTAKRKTSSFIALELATGSQGQTIELHYPNGVRAIVPVGIPVDVLKNLLNLTS